jgi:hypothetical protein
VGTQPDTLIPDPGNPQAWNRFSYVYNSPIVFNDPSGHAVACDAEVGHGCNGTGFGDATPSEILKSGHDDVDPDIIDRAIYNYALTHPEYNFQQDSGLEDTGMFLVANAIFLGDADYVSRKPSFWDRISESWDSLAYGTGLTFAAMIAGGGVDPNGHDTASISVHGNSLNSPKNTVLYQLVDRKTGEHLKFGITSQTSPLRRYSREFMEDKRVIYLFEGSRREMYELEESFILNNPRGRLQFGNH